jgi:hypothetical protein
MSSFSQDIQTVHSLRKSIRDPTVPASVLALIETIHRSIRTTDHNGWKTVDWRGSSHSHRAPSKPSANRPPHHAFGNRTVAASTSDETASTSTSTSTETRRSAWNETTDGFRTPHQKYVSKFKKTSGKVEDTILNTILLGKLNKFSHSNYNEIKEFITTIIDSGQTDMMKCFMKIVFEKAASEEIFCPLYAKLLSELSTLYPVLLTEMANLYTQYMEIFDEVAEDQTETYNEMCKRNVEKKYRRGYSQFLAELIKNNVMDIDTFLKILSKIIGQVEANTAIPESTKLIEEFADCLMRIMKAIRVDPLKHDENDAIGLIRSTVKSEIMMRIQPLSMRQPEMLGLSNKARFTFLDMYESIQRF